MPRLVADASALAEVLIGSRAGRALGEQVLTDSNELHAPLVLLDLECHAALRKLILRRELTEQRAAQARADLGGLRIRRWPLDPALLDRVWSLRHNLTPYDAAYAALADLLEAMLVTADLRLARTAEKDLGLAVLTGR